LISDKEFLVLKSGQASTPTLLSSTSPFVGINARHTHLFRASRFGLDYLTRQWSNIPKSRNTFSRRYRVGCHSESENIAWFSPTITIRLVSYNWSNSRTESNFKPDHETLAFRTNIPGCNSHISFVHRLVKRNSDFPKCGLWCIGKPWVRTLDEN
jgi:hypothetical protein